MENSTSDFYTKFFVTETFFWPYENKYFEISLKNIFNWTNRTDFYFKKTNNAGSVCGLILWMRNKKKLFLTIYEVTTRNIIEFTLILWKNWRVAIWLETRAKFFSLISWSFYTLKAPFIVSYKNIIDKTHNI